MDIKIESATLRLLDRLYEIEKQSFQKEAFSKQQIRYLLTDYNAISLIASIENEVAGFVIGRLEVTRETSYGHIFTIETMPEYRRKGVAEKLLRELEKLFREKGASESRLEVREDNLPAINLYKKLGYKPMGRLEGYYGNAHGLYLKKNLTQSED